MSVMGELGRQRSTIYTRGLKNEAVDLEASKDTLWRSILRIIDAVQQRKAERQGIDAFELWCWRRLLRVPWTARRCSQSILKEISPGCSLEGRMLKLKLQYFGHLM